MTIKLLTQNLINQIAAGEVIERPSSVIKELMENAIDAGASEIDVHIADAGKSFISIRDNGIGMDKNSLELCVLSHATSKLSSENLFDIQTFGFRGEALPSIASVSRVSITSAKKPDLDSSFEDQADCWCIRLEGDNNLGLIPSSRPVGTTVEVRDLFFATPARLKFLKSDVAETESCRSVVERIALASNGISFRFFDADKEKLNYPKTESLQKRIEDVFGKSFIENTFSIDVQIDNLRLRGCIGVPTFNKTSTSHQYFFVNNRFVKDKIFASSIKSAYSGLVPQGRHAVAVLYLDIPHNEVDVNAHPAKIEIRFRNAESVRYFMVSELKKALTAFGSSRSATEIVDNFYLKTRQEAASLAKPSNFSEKISKKSPFEGLGVSFSNPPKQQSIVSVNFPSMRDEKSNKHANNLTYNSALESFANASRINNISDDVNDIPQDCSNEKISLGMAICQISNAYIVATDGENLIVIDQHAAAERITLEELKNSKSLDSQTLLMPEVCSLTPAKVELIEKNTDLLSKFGIFFEKLSHDMVVVNSLPSILQTCNAKSLMEDMADELSNFGEAYSLEEKINHTLSTISCHSSLRAGQHMSLEEMNSLIRLMENTPNIAQCCHGRPSYIVLSNKILSKFFDRH